MTDSHEKRSNAMKVVVIGGTGLVGSGVVAKLQELGHEAVPASPESGVNTITGEGLDEVLTGAGAVVDASNAPAWEDEAVMEFFQTSSRNLTAAAAKAGVGHYVAFSIVGADRLPDSGYLRAKVAQEEIVKSATVPYTIVRSTQFFEFVGRIADEAASGDTVHLPPVGFQPAAAPEIGAAVAAIAVGEPADGAPFRPGDRRFPRRQGRRAAGDRRPQSPLLRDRAQHRVADPGERRPADADPLRRLARTPVTH
jgi:uncharacterized protein YbjT (DUF2867 family)